MSSLFGDIVGGIAGIATGNPLIGAAVGGAAGGLLGGQNKQTTQGSTRPWVYPQVENDMLNQVLPKAQTLFNMPYEAPKMMQYSGQGIFNSPVLQYLQSQANAGQAPNYTHNAGGTTAPSPAAAATPQVAPENDPNNILNLAAKYNLSKQYSMGPQGYNANPTSIDAIKGLLTNMGINLTTGQQAGA